MRITITGHAGAFIETTGGSILCDPWFNPAFFGSWYPFPAADTLDISLIAEPDYLYISHLHRDHLDPVFLSDHVGKSARVLLPEYGIGDLENELRALGFTDFIQTHNDAVIELDGGLSVAIRSLAGPHIGPMGDSALVVADPTAVVLNQNDAHPADLSVVDQFGRCDAHLLQHSGAIWYPMVYDIDPDEEARLIADKRHRQISRAMDYIDMVDARFVVPTAGPPCFLDPDTFHLNDFSTCEPDSDPTIFPDATFILDHLGAAGRDGGTLMIPGSTLVVGGDDDGCVTHPISDDAVAAIFTDKRAYLTTYQATVADLINHERDVLPTDTTDLESALATWLDPILEIADHTAAGVGGNVLLASDDGMRVILDLDQRKVRPAAPGERAPFEFEAARALLESSIRRRVPDWCNELFLSCRFTARRAGAYNEYVYTMFKSLSLDRMRYAEDFYAKQLASTTTEWVTCDGWVVAKRCPHQRAALDRVGSVEGDVLTCGLHGWQFELPSGRCLNSEGAYLEVRGRVEHIDE